MAEDDQLNGQLFKDLIQNTGNNVTVDWVINGVEVMEKVANKSLITKIKYFDITMQVWQIKF